MRGEAHATGDIFHFPRCAHSNLFRVQESAFNNKKIIMAKKQTKRTRLSMKLLWKLAQAYEKADRATSNYSKTVEDYLDFVESSMKTPVSAREAKKLTKI